MIVRPLNVKNLYNKFPIFNIVFIFKSESMRRRRRAKADVGFLSSFLSHALKREK